ncbi:MAG: hypothetical protein MR508_06155 [Lachnospiraceae bacterium]|nr:hypothetical protein [Lachnospiraceae bacterium]
MSTKISSGLSLSSSYFMRNYYAENRNAAKKSGRSDYSKAELSFEDSRALSRAAKKITSMDFGSERDETDSDIGATAKASIEAFVETYNNTMESAKSSSNADTSHYYRQLKRLTSKYADQLEDIGISIESNGKLSINDDLLKAADNSKARKLLSSDSDFAKKTLTIAKKMNSAIREDLFAQISSQKIHINITL